MSDEPYRISLQDLKKAAIEATKKFQKGDRVVIDYSYSGIWAELGGLTGTILKVREDGFWTFDIALDHPQFVSDLNAWNSTPDGGLYASLGSGGVFLLSEIQAKQPEIISKLNRGQGLVLRPFCTDAPILTEIETRLDAVDDAIEDRRVVHRKNLNALVKLRKKYVDTLPEIIKAEEHRDSIQDPLEKAKADEVWRKLFEEKHQWANANIAELGEADAKYRVTSREFYDFEKQKLKELDQILHEYVGRRHASLVPNGKVETDSYDFINTPLRCTSCGWAFIVRERTE